MLRFVPSRLLLSVALVPVVLATLTVLRPTLLGPMLAFDALCVLVAMVDAAFAQFSKVTIEREAPDVMSLLRRNRVRLRLRTRSRRALQVVVQQELFRGASSPDLPLYAELPARGSVSLSYHIQPAERGAHTLGAHQVRVTSPLRLWAVQRSFPAHQAVRVYPDLKQLQAFDARARENREHSLVRVSRLKGGESEFARLRDHVPDDDHRRVDWKATAKRQKLTVREFQLESNQTLMFLLDAGRVMTGFESGLSRFDHALNATLMLGHVAARGGDRVGVLGFDDQVRAFVPPQVGKIASRSLIQATYDLFPRLVEPDYDLAFGHLALRVKNRALVVLFTHVLDSTVGDQLVRRVRAIAHRHLPLVVCFRDADVEALLDPKREQSWYTKGAAAELVRFQKSVVQQMQSAGALVLETNARSLTGALVSRYLEIKAQRLL